MTAAEKAFRTFGPVAEALIAGAAAAALGWASSPAN
jgi:hypothetical protein